MHCAAGSDRFKSAAMRFWVRFVRFAFSSARLFPLPPGEGRDEGALVCGTQRPGILLYLSAAVEFQPGCPASDHCCHDIFLCRSASKSSPVDPYRPNVDSWLIGLRLSKDDRPRQLAASCSAHKIARL